MCSKGSMRDRSCSLLLTSMVFYTHINVSCSYSCSDMTCSLMTMIQVRSAECQHGQIGCCGEEERHKVTCVTKNKCCIYSAAQDHCLMTGVRGELCGMAGLSWNSQIIDLYWLSLIYKQGRWTLLRGSRWSTWWCHDMMYYMYLLRWYLTCYQNLEPMMGQWLWHLVLLWTLLMS